MGKKLKDILRIHWLHLHGLIWFYPEWYQNYQSAHTFIYITDIYHIKYFSSIYSKSEVFRYEDVRHIKSEILSPASAFLYPQYPLLTSLSNSQTSWPVTRHSQISLARFQPRYRVASCKKNARNFRWASKYWRRGEGKKKIII